MYWLLNLNTMKNTFIPTLIAIMITLQKIVRSVFSISYRFQSKKSFLIQLIEMIIQKKISLKINEILFDRVKTLD